MCTKIVLLLAIAAVLCHVDGMNKSLTSSVHVVGPTQAATKNKNLLLSKFYKDKKKNQLSTPPPPKKKHGPDIITPEIIAEWAERVSENLYENERLVVRRDVLLEGFSAVPQAVRDGPRVARAAAAALDDVLTRRVDAARRIMRRAEELTERVDPTPDGYTFMDSVELNEMKKKELLDDEGKNIREEEWNYTEGCRSLLHERVSPSAAFDARVSLDSSSVHVAAEVFKCEPKVVQAMHWSEGLLSVFKQNYVEDARTSYQYLCSAKGFLRHYPAAVWSDMLKLQLDDVSDLYDCRLRPWYVAAGGAPRDILVLVDASGSMFNSSNKVKAEQFTLALLTALTDDDHVNVLRFNVDTASPISCFNDKMVPANHVNSAAMMAGMQSYWYHNETWMKSVLEEAVKLLQEQRISKLRPPACQQAIVLLTDSVYGNFSELLEELDPEGSIRLFTMWLHDINGLRDSTREYGEWLSCERDARFAELVESHDVTEQVLRVLQVLERPLVHQRKERLALFSDIYVHVEDPRRSEYQWRVKENLEQSHRYQRLRKDKTKFLNSLPNDQLHKDSLDKYGHYYEGELTKYRYQISVSVPVFEHTTVENITIKLSEENQRNSTRTYPVNRLLGVAGVDIPLEELKLILPYDQLGAGGSLFVVDHRGNIVLHDNLKPVFDGDILKPGYRTVDMIDLEQPGSDHMPRAYPKDWLDFRKAVIIDNPSGSKTVFGRNVFEAGMRQLLEPREYSWQRVQDHYTVVVVLPRYNRHHALPPENYTQQLAERAFHALKTDFSVHPEWLYCRHIEPYFTSRIHEVLHFVRRRRDEPAFAFSNLRHFYSPIAPALLDKTYQCNDKLMARLCHEAVATERWAREGERPGVQDCDTCHLGSTTAFFASESGLTRWQHYHATSQKAEPPDGAAWPRGPGEPWYARAAAAPDLLVVHTPVLPHAVKRNTFEQTPPPSERSQWLTAARVLARPGGAAVGVAGYHFHPEHFLDLLKNIFSTCPDDECPEYCDDESWSCVAVDEGGWLAGGGGHLARAHPAAMSALLNASVFRLRWLHDYQAVCLPPEDETRAAGNRLIPALMNSVWSTIKVMAQLTKHLFAVLTIIASTAADTKFEKEKRRKHLFNAYRREQFDSLYDERVLVNRTRPIACDRSRPLYELQRTEAAMAALRRPPRLLDCEWPLAGAPVPGTNLLLLAVYRPCPPAGRAVPDPLNNEQVDMPEHLVGKHNHTASRLACWRNRVPLPGRPPHVRCYPHVYADEKGYRQCGPWLPDPEPEESAAAPLGSKSPQVFTIIILLLCHPSL